VPKPAPVEKNPPENPVLETKPIVQGPPVAPPPKEPLYKKWWPWTIAGVVVVGVAVGVGVGVSQSSPGGTTFPRVAF
jgi:hypothetical protein